MIVFAEISVLSGLFLMFFVAIALFGLATKPNFRAFVWLLGGGFLILILLGFSFSFLSARQISHSDAQDENPADTDQISTEQMWEHLHRSRIVLDSDEKTTRETEDAKPQAASRLRLSDFENILETKDSAKQKRPVWVDHPPKRVGNVYRVTVSAGPYSDAEECHRALVPKLLDVVHQRITQLTASGDRPNFDQLGLGLDFVLREICHEEWVESMERSYAEMKIVHVQMEFDAAVDKQLRSAVRDYQRESRIIQVGGIAGLSLGGLALLFGLLKMDTWTRGYYTKRLFLGVPAVIITLVLLWM